MIEAWNDGTLTGVNAAWLALAMTVALGFEFVNGFHDTANAVATVIYTHSLSPRKAVAWSGLCNFLGVYLGGTAVAFSVVYLLPVGVLVSGDTGTALAMVLALLLAAIAWNLGTWALGLPASSSHTLIGSILGVGLANAAIKGLPFGTGVNWSKAGEVGLSLLISPLAGFTLAAALLLLVRALLVHRLELCAPPPPDTPPPFWVRSTLVATCTGVSLAHGSNDGQKGIGLVMLILIGLVPSHYALNPHQPADQVARLVGADESLKGLIRENVAEPDRAELLAALDAIERELNGKSTLSEVPRDRRWELRGRLLVVNRALERLETHPPRTLDRPARARLKRAREALGRAVFYAPTWVLAAVASALGLGTTVGWRRIVITVGEKIGKAHLTYAQGAVAEIVAVGTIGLADFGGMPVSTTHVLSSGVAGTMAASRAGLQFKTVRNIALAWVLTLPVAMALSALIYTALRPLMASPGTPVLP